MGDLCEKKSNQLIFPTISKEYTNLKHLVKELIAKKHSFFIYSTNSGEDYICIFSPPPEITP